MLNVSKRKDKEYLYITVNGSKRLYLGTSDKPKKEMVIEAIQHLNNKIKRYEDEIQKLESLLYKEIQEFGYKLVIFDLDGVIYDKPWQEITSDKIAVSTWDVLFQELGFYNVHEDYKQKYIKGAFKTYMEWTDTACNFLKSLGLDRNTFENIINQRPLTQGAVEVFQALHKNKVITAIITGSFDALAQQANKKLGGIDHIFAHCKLHFNSNASLESWQLQPTDYKDKAVFVEQIAKQHNISLKRCAYIGDDVNDIEAFKKVGLSIAFKSNKIKVRQAAKVVIESRDLRSILPNLYVIRDKTPGM